MSLSGWAESVLFGDRLEDKLRPAVGELDRVAAIEAPLLPGRPPELALLAERSRAPFPESLEEPKARGRALHFFANHELLAIELMALALLRFPDAPPEFRKGLVRTLGEEQAHLRAYLSRMSALGVELGEQPLGGFFWRSMRGIEKPLDYVAAMSLTFEQANLDFTKSYAEQFRAVGDHDSAKILQTIHDDEIRHVGHGVKWFAPLGGGALDFAGYQKALIRPLTARRAKGQQFDREGRLAAGLDAAYVEAIERHHESRATRPKAWVFLSGAEDQLAGRPAKVNTEALAADLALLLALYAAPSDVVLVPRKPSPAHVDRLAAAGIKLPELTESLAGRALGRLAAFGGGPALEAIAAKVELDHPLVPVPPHFWDKRFGARLLAECSSPSQLVKLPEWALPIEVVDLAGLSAFRAAVLPYAAQVIVKAPLSNSGRHRVRLPTHGALEPATINRLSKLFATGSLRAEAWLDKVADLSVQLEVAAEDPVHNFGRFYTDRQGQYLGHFLGPARASFDPALLRSIDFGTIEAEAARVGRFVARRLAAEGFTGPAGVDLLLYKDGDRLALHPLLELNPRLTMGHLAHALRRFIKPGVLGRFDLVPIADAKTTVLPEVVMHTKTGRIESGAVWLTDLHQATIVAARLSVG